jgi:hypothetical protein
MRALKVDLYAGMSVAGGCVGSSHDRPHKNKKKISVCSTGIKGKKILYGVKFASPF